MSNKAKGFYTLWQKVKQSSTQGFSCDKRLTESFPVINLKNEQYLVGLIKVSNAFDPQQLYDLNILFDKQSSDKLKVKIPLARLDYFFNLGKVKFFEI